MANRTFVGFGFGPIQSGLFLYEAFRSRNFKRLVVAEVSPELVAAVRRADGCYQLNIAAQAGIEVHQVRGVEIFNPLDAKDRAALIDALAEANEVATALPSVDFFSKGDPSVAAILAAGFQKKLRSSGPACVLYAGENHNHAAELLQAAVLGKLAPGEGGGLLGSVQFLNTVIGKMSGVADGVKEIDAAKLVPAVPAGTRAILVEAFNRILISRITLPGFARGIEVFEEKNDLLPFEEAKLYGHNAAHALLGYLAHQRGLQYMSDIAAEPELLQLAREAFLRESGPALEARHRGLDPLFTPAGYRAYAEDLLVRMVNPHLQDKVSRIIRDTRRKLSWPDRLVGTMRLVLDAGIQPKRYAKGAAAALRVLQAETPAVKPEELLLQLWPEADQPPGRKAELVKMILAAL